MLMLPPVNCMPNCGWAYAAFTGAATTRTFVRSTSSSSAMSMGRDVEMPCPISALFTRMVTTFCRLMRMKALGAKSPAAVGPAAAPPGWARTGTRKASRMPPDSAAVLRKSRREARPVMTWPRRARAPRLA
jgi:hypothetical protein